MRTCVLFVVLAFVSGCDAPVEPQGTEPPPAPAAAVQTEQSVAQRVLEMEAQMNQGPQQTTVEPGDEPVEEPRKSPIKIVPTRPMFQEEPLEESPVEPVYEEYEQYEEEGPIEIDEGPQITEFHLKNLREQQSLYIIRDLMPVPGVLIDRYYKGRTEYEVWEWRSYNEEDGETLVRIRFIDGDASRITINPGEYKFVR